MKAIRSMLGWAADSRPQLLLAFALVAGFLALPQITVQAQKAADSKDMKLLGYNDLQARSAYQPTIEKQGDRYIAYIGHHGGESMNPLTGKVEPNGTSILDVTDPSKPKLLAHIPGEPRDPK